MVGQVHQGAVAARFRSGDAEQLYAWLLMHGNTLCPSH